MIIPRHPAQFVVALVLLASPSLGIKNSIAQTSAPSKAETVEYLKNKMVENPSDFSFKADFSNDGCILKMTGKGYDYSSVVDLRLTYVQFVDYRTGRYAIEIKCSSGDCIKVDKQKSASANEFVYTSDMQFANRIYKSLSHLKSLCVGRKELF